MRKKPAPHASLSELLRSDRYLEAKVKIRNWKESLAKAGKEETLAIRGNKSAFFKKMREGDPELYAVFKLNEKELSEFIFKNLAGMEVILY